MDLLDAKAKIQVLRDRLDYFAGEYKKDPLAKSLGLPQQRRYRNTDPLKIMDVFERFAVLRDVIKNEYPDLFGDLPARPLPDPPNEVPGACDGRGAITGKTSEVWLADMDDCFKLITSVEQRAASSVKVTREGIYFAGQTFDALLNFQEIISTAKRNISIIDGYVDEKVLKLLTAKATGVGVEVLTFRVSPALHAAAVTFNTQYGDLKIRTSRVFHDRFVIIDDTDFYHFGASIKDLATKGFMFSKIEEQSVIDALRTQYASEWATATIEV